MPDAPMKPTEAWAHVKIATGKVTYVLPLDYTSLDAMAVMEADERLARVVITEKEADHA